VTFRPGNGGDIDVTLTWHGLTFTRSQVIVTVRRLDAVVKATTTD